MTSADNSIRILLLVADRTRTGFLQIDSKHSTARDTLAEGNFNPRLIKRFLTIQRALKSSKWSLGFLQWQIMDNLGCEHAALHYSYISSRQDVIADPSFKRFCVGGSLFSLSYNTVGRFEIVHSKAVNRKKQYLQNDYILFYGRLFFYKQTPPRLYFTSKHLSQMIDAISSNKTSYPQANFFFWYQARF